MSKTMQELIKAREELLKQVNKIDDEIESIHAIGMIPVGTVVTLRGKIISADNREPEYLVEPLTQRFNGYIRMRENEFEVVK